MQHPFCVEKVPSKCGHDSPKVLSSTRKQSSVITLVEGNSGRKNPNHWMSPKPQTGRSQKDIISDSCSLPSEITENWRTPCLREGLGRQVPVQACVLTTNNLRDGWYMWLRDVLQKFIFPLLSWRAPQTFDWHKQSKQLQNTFRENLLNFD